MNLSVLYELGFTDAEGRVYTTLLKMGTVKVGKLMEKTGLQSSSTHNALQALVNRGFVSFFKKNKIKLYQAAPPSYLLEYYYNKKKKVEKIVSELKEMPKEIEEKEEIELFEGNKGVTTLLYKLIEDAKPGEEYLFFAVDVTGLNDEIQKFFRKYDAKRRAKGLITKGIAQKKLKYLFEKRTYLRMKYVEHPIPSNISICNDRMAMITWGEKPRGILIQSKQLVESQVDFFKEIWNSKD